MVASSKIFPGLNINHERERLARPVDIEYALTEAEITELRSVAEQWRAARIAKEWEKADALRIELEAWGAYPPENGRHSRFENGEHRQARLAKRAPE